MAGMEVISHTELSSTSGQIDITVPSGYTHLYLVTSLRSSVSNRYGSDGIVINDDTGNNYSYSAILATGGTPGATEDLGRPNFNYAVTPAGAGNQDDCFGLGHAWFFDYAATDKFKSITGGSSVPNTNLDSSDYFESMVHGHWKSTSAITKISIKDGYAPTHGFVQYSTATLYGLNSA